jgi:hypothetical protein
MALTTNVLKAKSKRRSQRETKNVKTHNRTTQKSKKMKNTDSTHVVAKDKQFLLLIRYPLCYSYTVRSGKLLKI